MNKETNCVLCNKILHIKYDDYFKIHACQCLTCKIEMIFNNNILHHINYFDGLNIFNEFNLFNFGQYNVLKKTFNLINTYNIKTESVSFNISTIPSYNDYIILKNKEKIYKNIL